MKWPAIAVVVALIFVGVAMYIAVFSATVRYRLTLEAEVDGEHKTGSGVIEVTTARITIRFPTASSPLTFAEKRWLSISDPEVSCLRC